ncbi:MAG: alpha/beta hydrolase [Bacteroidales bacterium]
MMKSVRYRDVSIAYNDKGEGDLLILLHGYLESSEVWDDFVPGLAQRYRVIAIDLPGHGQSSVSGNEHSMEFMADAVKAVIDHEDIGRCMMVGHSMGGYVTLAFIEKYPLFLRAYCLFHSHPYADTDEIIENRKREIKIVQSGKKDLIYPVNISKMFADFNTGRFSEELERHKEIASAIPAEGIIAVLNGMIHRPTRHELLEKGDIPLLLILGRYDNYISFGEMKNRIGLPQNAELLVLERSGHLGFVEEKEKSQEAIMDFYRRQPEADS